MPDNDGTKTSRRTLLKSTLIGTVGTLGFSGLGAAETSTKVTVTQGDREYTIEPLSYEDRTIEEFYDYRSAQANTPTNLERSDVSELFFYEGPNGLSLVVIHDRPNDGSGGAVTFDFTGLPVSEGGWVIPDDGGDLAGSDDTSPDWSWANSKTDGGVFRGGLESVDTLRIDPAFNEAASKRPLDSGRIDEWQLLSGDAADPERISLDLDAPITLSVGDGGNASPTLSTAMDEKRALASQVSGLAEAIDDEAYASAALDGLSSRVEDGTLDEATAVEAVERLKLGENVTETALAGLGSKAVGTPEDGDTLVGVPEGSPAARDEVSIIEQAVEHVTFLAVSGIAGVAALRMAKNIWGSPGAIATAIDALSSGVDAMLSLVPFAASFLKSESESASGRLIDTVREENIEDGELAFNTLSNLLEDALEGIAAGVQSRFERKADGPETTMRGRVKAFHETVGPTEDSDVTLSGSLDDAEEASRNAVESVQSQLDTVDRELDVTKYAAVASDILALVGSVIAAVSSVTGVGALVGGVLASGGILASASFNFLGAVAGIDGMYNVLHRHNDGLQSIANAGGR